MTKNYDETNKVIKEFIVRIDIRLEIMIADYFFNDGPGSPKKNQDKSGSFGFRSS